MVNDFQNPPLIGAEGAVEGLPKDIIIHDWIYNAVYHSDRTRTVNQLAFYLDRGYHVGGVAWFEPANVMDLLMAGEKKPEQFVGIMHGGWNGFNQSLMPIAQANWTGNIILGKLDFLTGQSDRMSKESKKVEGEKMFLPNPRKQVIVRRVLTEKEVELYYPGNQAVKELNKSKHSLYFGFSSSSERM